MVLSPCVDSNPNGLNKCASVEASERAEANMTYTGPSHLDLITDPVCLC